MKMPSLLPLLLSLSFLAASSLANPILPEDGNDTVAFKADVPYFPYHLHNYTAGYDEEEVRHVTFCDIL
jgi:hypothetical protein